MVCSYWRPFYKYLFLASKLKIKRSYGLSYEFGDIMNKTKESPELKKIYRGYFLENIQIWHHDIVNIWNRIVDSQQKRWDNPLVGRIKQGEKTIDASLYEIRGKGPIKLKLNITRGNIDGINDLLEKLLIKGIDVEQLSMEKAVLEKQKITKTSLQKLLEEKRKKHANKISEFRKKHGIGE